MRCSQVSFNVGTHKYDMDSRSALFELLVLESKGYLNLDSRRLIEMSCGWGEGSCDEELEFRKYLECYHHFLEKHPDHVVEHTHEFGIIQMFEDVDDLINEGHDFRQAVIKMIRDKFGYIKIPLAKPPVDMLREPECSGGDDWKFDGRIERNSIYFEIVKD